MLVPAAYRTRPQRRQSGFTLIEALVALLVVAIGLLGMAKLQAYALANTTVSAQRSLVAMQADSLAAIVQGNRAVFNSNGVPPTIYFADGSASDAKADGSGGSLITGTNTTKCISAACTGAATDILNADLQDWAQTLKNLVPTASGTLTCTSTSSAGGSSAPTNCLISISWVENNPGNGAIANAVNSSGTATQTYTQVLEP